MRAPPPNPLGPLHQRTAGRNKKRNTYRNDSHQGHAWLACGLARRHAKSHVFHKIFDASSTSVCFTAQWLVVCSNARMDKGLRTAQAWGVTTFVNHEAPFLRTPRPLHPSALLMVERQPVGGLVSYRRR